MDMTNAIIATAAGVAIVLGVWSVLALLTANAAAGNQQEFRFAERDLRLLERDKWRRLNRKLGRMVLEAKRRERKRDEDTALAIMILRGKECRDF